MIYILINSLLTGGNAHVSLSANGEGGVSFIGRGNQIIIFLMICVAKIIQLNPFTP